MVNSALPVLLFCCLKFFSWWIIHPRGIGRVYQVFISNLCGASQSNMSLWNSSPQQSLSFEKIKPKKMFCLFFWERKIVVVLSLSKKKWMLSCPQFWNKFWNSFLVFSQQSLLSNPNVMGIFALSKLQLFRSKASPYPIHLKEEMWIHFFSLINTIVHLPHFMFKGC